jgi:hypothetical protein
VESDGRGACVMFVKVDVFEVDAGDDMHVLFNLLYSLMMGECRPNM